MWEQSEDRSEENVTRSCDRREAPEAHEDAKNNQNIVDATDFACPCRVTDGFPDLFAVLDDSDTEGDGEET